MMENNECILRKDALKAILSLTSFESFEELEGARTITENTWLDGLYDAYIAVEQEVDAVTNDWTWHRCGDENPKDKSDIILWQGVHFHACFYEDTYGFSQLNEGSWWEFIDPNDDDKWAYIHYNE